MDSNSNMRVSANPTMPNNASLQQTIQNTRAALDDARSDAPLNSKGQMLVEDAKQLMDSTARLISEKNGDERMQRLIGNSYYAARDTRTGVSGTNMPVGREDLQGMRGEAREAYYASKDLVLMCIRSKQFRDIIMELIELVQTMLKSTQEKIGQNSQINPSQVASQMANETVIPEEQKQQMYDRFRNLLVQLSQRPEYSAAVDHLFTVFDHLQSTSGQLKSTATEVASTSAVPTDKYQDIFQDAVIIMEQFSGQGTVEELNRRIQSLFVALRQDEQAKAYFLEARNFVRECLKNPAMLQDQQKTNYAKNLVERGRVLLTGKYRPYFSDLTDQARTIFVNIRNDSVTQDFATKLQKFVSDFAFDEQGRPDLFVLQNSFNQMKSFMVPMISRAMANLPVPRIQGSNDKYDFAIDGLVLSVGDLLPDFIDIRTKTDNRMNVQHLANDKRSTKIVMEVERIRALFRGVHFWYRRKHMPKLEDEGVADVDLSQGTGVTIKLVWKLSSVNGQPYQLRLSRVLCNISKLKITIRNARHNVLDKLVTKLFAGMIKKQIATSIVNNIQKAVQPLGTRLNSLFKTKPAHGFADRINTQMKGALFTGSSDQRSMIDRARGAVTQGAQQIKQRRQRRANYGRPAYRPTLGDMNGNGIPDYMERPVYRPIPGDMNRNGIPDYMERPAYRPAVGDLNANGVPDYLERGVAGPVMSGDFYHTPEWEQDFQWYHPSQYQTTGWTGRGGYGSALDRNGNGVPDFLERGTGYRPSVGDRNANGVPDYMESPRLDRNRNGIPDYMESPRLDRNRNGVPDYLERGTGYNNYTDDLDDDFQNFDLDDDLDVHNDNKWNNNKWNSVARTGSGRLNDFDDSNDDFVGHDWTRGSDYNRYTSL